MEPADEILLIELRRNGIFVPAVQEKDQVRKCPAPQVLQQLFLLFGVEQPPFRVEFDGAEKSRGFTLLARQQRQIQTGVSTGRSAGSKGETCQYQGRASAQPMRKRGPPPGLALPSQLRCIRRFTLKV
jgi:hypothetical protein